MTGLHLQCDANGCGHVEEVPTLSQELVGKPCPKCGANLLTQRDFDEWGEIQTLIETLRALGVVTDDPNVETKAISVGLHEGTLTVKGEV